MQKALEGLKPERVFWWFDQICQIPHGSGFEGNLSKRIGDHFEALSYEVIRDSAHNLIIKKAASPGYEKFPTVILEAHLDMVWEKTEDSPHDFLRDPIRVKRDGNRLYADGTTLGADDGTGVAFALAVLENKEQKHPALEVVLTTGEENGLIGIKKLDFDRLSGKVVMNLDCSDEGIVVGCAGASVCAVTLTPETETAKEENAFYRLRVSGLLGGHCGLHIGKERQNANILLARILGELRKQIHLNLVSVNGGTQTGAIPRSAECVFAADAGKETMIRQLAMQASDMLKHELRVNDPGLLLEMEKVPGQGSVFTKESSDQYITFMNLLPSGVLAMDQTAENMPETSCNVGIVETKDQKIRILCNCRSNFGSKKAWLLEKCRLLCEQTGIGTFRILTDYPEWEYNPDSPLRRLIEETYEKLEGEKLLVERSHGGNECGTFYKKIDGADIVCMGTKIHNAHSPMEWVGIDVIQKEYRLLCGVLEEMKNYNKGGQTKCTNA